MIEARRLHILRAVADHRTVTAAAAALYLTPSAVSMRNWCASTYQRCAPRRPLAASPRLRISCCQAGCATVAASIGANQRCMPPCSALYSTGCQCARCGACSSVAPSTVKQAWRRVR